MKSFEEYVILRENESPEYPNFKKRIDFGGGDTENAFFSLGLPNLEEIAADSQIPKVKEFARKLAFEIRDAGLMTIKDITKITPEQSSIAENVKRQWKGFVSQYPNLVSGFQGHIS
jgi:hypothetical protein